MKITRFGRFVMFVLSYYILFVFLIFESSELKDTILLPILNFSIGLNWLIFIILSIFVIFSTSYIFFWRKLPKKVFEITEIRNLSAETLNYLVSLMMGLFFFNASIYDFKIILLLVLLYLVYTAGGIYYLQPILMLFGYKVFKCKIENGNEIMLITKEEELTPGKKNLEELFNKVYLMR